MSQKVSFVAKVSKTKTRTKGDTTYFTFRLNVPNEISEKLDLDNGDYLFIHSAMKAKWYHMLNWKEMDNTWRMLPSNLQKEIQSSGLSTPLQTNQTLRIVGTITNALNTPIEEYLTFRSSGITNSTSLNQEPQQILPSITA